MEYDDLKSIQDWAEQQIRVLGNTQGVSLTPTPNIDTIIKLQQLRLQADQTEAMQVIAGVLIEISEKGKPETSAVEMRKIGEVGVDSGSVWIGDPCYFWETGIQNKAGTWQEASEKFLGAPYPKHYNFGIWGVMASTALGDGIYPVYAEIENETIKRITIDFLADSDDDEEDEDEGEETYG